MGKDPVNNNGFVPVGMSDSNSEASFESTYGPGTAADKKKRTRSRIIWIIIFIIVNGAVIAYTAVQEFSGTKPKLGWKFGFSNVMLIVAGFACLFTALLCETLKYVVMMKDLGEKVSFRTAFETAALGKYYDSITPSGAGGQPFQIYHMHKKGYSTGASAAMPLAGFMFMQLAFVFLALVVFIIRGNVIEAVAYRITAYIGAVCYSIVPFFIILFAISDKLVKKIVMFIMKIGGKLRLIKNVEERTRSIMSTLEEYHTSLKLIARKRGLIIKLAALSIIYQFAICSIPFFVLHAYNGTGSFPELFAMTVYIYSAITIIPTPGNSGAAEGSFYMIFSRLDSSGLFWGMLIWRLICYYTFIIIGVLIYGYNALTGYLRKKAQSDNVRT